jgi:hypothetical protein
MVVEEIVLSEPGVPFALIQRTTGSVNKQTIFLKCVTWRIN